MEEKVQEIEELKKVQEELKTKTTKEIIELKKETDRLIVENDNVTSPSLRPAKRTRPHGVNHPGKEPHEHMHAQND